MNRFLKTTDNKSQTIGNHEIPIEWWSRIYEYEWAKQFVIKKQSVLDAGCGIEHPFKYYLADNGCKVTAVDIDERINDLKYKNVTFLQTELKKLSSELPHNSFDTIFCISVLEHTKSALKSILNGFSDILKNDGKIVLTFDHPLLTFEELYQILLQTDLEFEGKIDFELKNDDLIGTTQSFRIFVCVLKKKITNIISQETKPLIPSEIK